MVDLIYADENGIDIDILHKYSFDLAYGKDENNFELALPIQNSILKDGYLLYIEDTEYGGVVDSCGVNTKERKVIYSGRTWHGILAGKVVEPDSGEDYLILQGDANRVIEMLIERCDLKDVFSVEESDSGFDIEMYQARYGNLYAVLTDMLSEVTAKLKIVHKGNKTVLSAIPYIDYSQDEEWDSSQRDFNAKRNYRPVNHLVCLGSGNLKNRHVIHLYADENGGIIPYATSSEPLRDSEYILDTSGQILKGLDEVAAVYDYPNAEDTENYILMSEKPEDFDTNFENYYFLQDGVYERLYAAVVEEYQLQTIKPSNWAAGYANYYELVNAMYSRVEAEVTEVYKRVDKKPKDWSKNYKNYYYYYTDGVEEIQQQNMLFRRKNQLIGQQNAQAIISKRKRKRGMQM